MELILFTKIFAGCPTEEVGRTASELGFAGLDLAVRRGQCIEPECVRETLPAAVKMWQEMGLSVPMLTLEGDFTNPQAPDVETVYTACHECGISLVKLGYWGWRPGDNYWQRVDSIRRNLDGFARWGEQYGVCSLVHTHAGGNYGGNVSAARQLVEGFDPEFIGLYTDPAHQALEGEPIDMALGIAGKYLRMIGIKNVCHVKAATAGKTSWQSQWCLSNEGLVDWPQAMASIQASEYSGTLSFHATYSAFRDKDGALKQTAIDLRYLRPLLS